MPERPPRGESLGYVGRITNWILDTDSHHPILQVRRALRRNGVYVSLGGSRHGLSRLVRRSWAHAKRAHRLERALWVYLLWRNYVRSVTNARRDESPAMAIGIEKERWTTRGIVSYSARFPSLLVAH